MTEFPNYETLSLAWRAPGVLGLTFNRPQERNAVDMTMHRELVECLHGLQDISDLGAVLLTGSGKTFCAGGSMEMIQDFATADWRASIRSLEQAVRLVQELLMVRPPVIAAVQGAAIGLGATLALLCDVIVMAEDAVIADTHVKAGIVAGDGGTLIWPAVLGPARAKEYLMTGRKVSANDAERWGLVNHVVSPEQLQDRALELAVELAGGARQAIAWTKQVVNATLLREVMSQMPLAVSLEARTMQQPDMLEGTAAFLERRPPRWPSNEPEQS
ncbi:MAG: enoyl-CoA hydratase/isomerase family protein [Solirubrobacteraceae bacterium]